jgi:hypothetical protein
LLEETDQMADGEFGSRRFLLPEAIVDELKATGYVPSANGPVGGVGAGRLVLVVFNTTLSAVTLLQAPGVIPTLAKSLADWFQRGGSSSNMFELAARGPHGAMTFRSDSAPDAEALTEFLCDNVWGDAAP